MPDENIKKKTKNRCNMRPLKVTPCFMIETGERNLVIRIIALILFYVLGFKNYVPATKSTGSSLSLASY